jgi:hypothetical protein
MNITESTLTRIVPKCFERQSLECLNCGDHDSRIAFVPAEMDQPNTTAIASPASMPTKHAEPGPMPLINEPIGEMPSEPPQAADPQIGEKSFQPAKGISDLIQSYMIKWRRPDYEGSGKEDRIQLLKGRQ